MQLKDICCAQSSNIALKDLKHNSGPYPIYGASGFITCVDFFKVDKPYVGVVKDGAGVGRVMLLPEKSSVIGTMQSIIPTAGTDAKYLSYLLDFLDLGRFCSGATIPHIYFKDYGKETIPTHSPEQQQEISAALDKITKLIALRQGQLAKLDQLAKSRFLEMFGDPVTNPREWETLSLDKLGELNRGVSKARPRNSPDLLDGIYPLVQTGEVSDSDTYITNFEQTYSEKGLAQSKMWQAGTLCITIAANIAQTAILTFDACFPDSVVGFVANDKTKQLFIHYWFKFFQKILDEQAPQVAQKNINLKILRELQVIVPPKPLQDEFCRFIEQLDKSKVIGEKQRFILEKITCIYILW